MTRKSSSPPVSGNYPPVDGSTPDPSAGGAFVPGDLWVEANAAEVRAARRSQRVLLLAAVVAALTLAVAHVGYRAAHEYNAARVAAGK